MDSVPEIIVRRRAVPKADADDTFERSYASGSGPFSDESEYGDETSTSTSPSPPPPQRPSRTSVQPAMLTARVLADLTAQRTKLMKLRGSGILPKGSDMEDAIEMDLEENAQQTAQVTKQVNRMTPMEQSYVNVCVKRIMIEDFLTMLRTIGSLPTTRNWTKLMDQKVAAIDADVKRLSVV